MFPYIIISIVTVSGVAYTIYLFWLTAKQNANKKAEAIFFELNKQTNWDNETFSRKLTYMYKPEVEKCLNDLIRPSQGAIELIKSELAITYEQFLLSLPKDKQGYIILKKHPYPSYFSMPKRLQEFRNIALQDIMDTIIDKLENEFTLNPTSKEMPLYLEGRYKALEALIKDEDEKTKQLLQPEIDRVRDLYNRACQVEREQNV